MLEALNREMSLGCPEELLYVDDLALVSETTENLKTLKGLLVNVKNTKHIDQVSLWSL